MKKQLLTKYLMLLIGAFILLNAAIAFWNICNFLSGAVSTTGVVVDLELRRSVGSGAHYYPVVNYTDDNNQLVRFTSAVGSVPAPYEEGDRVAVLYQPNQPDSARIGSFYYNWGESLALLILGAPLFWLGLWIQRGEQRVKRKKEYLEKHGTEVQAEITDVWHRSVAGKSSYIIICEWLDPQTSRIHEFESEDICFEPSDCIVGGKVRVLVDRNNPKTYYVDISFLPNHTI